MVCDHTLELGAIHVLDSFREWLITTLDVSEGQQLSSKLNNKHSKRAIQKSCGRKWFFHVEMKNQGNLMERYLSLCVCSSFLCYAFRAPSNSWD